MQPYFFPYLGYFQLINAVEQFVILDNVNYIKRGFVNRNYILLNNQAYLITLPIDKASQNRPINQHQHLKQVDKLFKTITTTYKKAPYFKQVIEIVEKCLYEPEVKLEKYLSYQLQLICDYLEISTNFTYASDYAISEQSSGQQKIIDICLATQATDYINPAGGVEIYDRALFAEHNLNINFINTEAYCYQQFNDEFVNNLSIIDVLMFNSKTQVQTLLTRYKLK